MSSGGPNNAATQVCPPREIFVDGIRNQEKLAYQGVIDDVVKNVRELFLNDGVDEQVLSDLKEIWEAKLEESGVMNHPPPLIHKNKAPGETAAKHFQPPAQQQSWSMHQHQPHQHQPHHQQQSPQHKRHHHHQQQQVQSVLPSVTSSVGSHITGPPALTSISTSLPVPPLVSQVMAAENATTSTTQSSVSQSAAALLQSNIASAAATGSVLPNLQYMLPGTAQGSNPSGYTFIVDSQTRMPLVMPLNLQVAKQLQALQQQAAAVAAASRSSTSVSSTSTSQPFSVIQNPALSAMAAGTMGGDATVASVAASQQGKTSQSQSSNDSSQVDGTQPLLNTDTAFSTDQLLCEPEERLLLHKNFQAVKSKQLSREHYQSSSLSDSDCVSTKKIPFASSTSCSTGELLMKSSDTKLTAIPQLDGANQESSEEEESEDSEDDDEAVNQDAAEGDDDPLNSDDDDESLKSDDDEKFETENIIVCQFDKVTRTRIGGKNRWKFHLKDGIMNLEGRDYVFQKATGEADW